MAREEKPIEGTYPQVGRALFLGNGSTEVPRKKRAAKAGQVPRRSGPGRVLGERHPTRLGPKLN